MGQRQSCLSQGIIGTLSHPLQQTLSQKEAELEGTRAKLEQELRSLGGKDLAGRVAALEQAEVSREAMCLSIV